MKLGKHARPGMGAVKRVLEIDFIECDLIGYDGRPLRYPGNDKPIRLSRSPLDWNISGSRSINTVDVVFPECGPGPGVFHAVGVAIYAVSRGKYRVIAELNLTISLRILAGITPTFPPGQLIIDARAL